MFMSAPLSGLDRWGNDHVTTTGPGYGALDQQKITFSVHPNNLEILNGATHVSHVPGHFLTLEYTTRCLALANRAGCAVVLQTALEILQKGLPHPPLSFMWTVQEDDGGFDWLKCDWPPMESDDHYGVTFAALGIGQAPDGYAETPLAKKGLEGIRKYLAQRPRTSTPIQDRNP